MLSPPERSEYFNETVFLTSEDCREAARCSVRELAGARSVILMSDGLELVLIDLARQEPHAPAFAGLLEFFRRSDRNTEEKEVALAEFLASDRVSSRTGDDKSLLAAVLAPASTAETAEQQEPPEQAQQR